MVNQNIHIINFDALYKIFYEIKDNLSFNILNHNTEEDFLNQNNIYNKNSLIIINPNKTFFNNNIDNRMIFKIENFPVKLNNLIENINVQLIKQRYNYQSQILVKKYSIDLNSRIISNKTKNLKLTEKEIGIILFLNEAQKPQKVNVLQSKIWKYSDELETHTVETHIYRLRKKIKDVFNDNDFINSHEDGYLIK
jgi:hypothetical protein